MSSPLAPVASWPVERATVLVTRHGTVVDGCGDADRSFPLASITKLFTAYATLLAVEEGAVGLDAPAGPPGATIRHLLAHAAGYGFESGSAPVALPGRRRIYSNEGIEVLARAVAASTEIAFGEYLAEGVLAPLGLETRLHASPAYGLTATATEVSGFLHEVLHPTLLAPETVTEALHVQFPGLDGVLPGFGRHRPLDWGLGFEIKSTKAPHWTGTLAHESTVGHFGGSGTFAWADPTRDLVCICLTDRRFGPWAPPLWSALSDAVVAAYGS